MIVSFVNMVCSSFRRRTYHSWGFVRHRYTEVRFSSSLGDRWSGSTLQVRIRDIRRYPSSAHLTRKHWFKKLLSVLLTQKEKHNQRVNGISHSAPLALHEKTVIRGVRRSCACRPGAGPVEENPYQSPVEQSPPDQVPVATPEAVWRHRLSWVALAWVAFLVLYLPAPNLSRAAPGTFLWFKIVTTAISAVAGATLIFIPRGWWKVATIPLAGVLALVQAAAWSRLP